MYEQNIKQYNDEGFTVVTGFFSPEDLLQIETELQKFIETYSKQLKWDEINFTKTGEINSIHRIAGKNAPADTFFSKMLDSPKMKNLAKLFLNDDPEPRAMELFAKPPRSGLKSPWHQDNFYWCIDGGNALTIWAALDFSGAENGGVEYIKESHKLGVIPHKDSFAPGSSQTVANDQFIADSKDNITCPEMKPGDLLIHHSQTIHGSKDNLSDRSRRGLTFQYKGLHSTYNKEMQDHYLSRLNAQVEARAGNK